MVLLAITTAAADMDMVEIISSDFQAMSDEEVWLPCFNWEKLNKAELEDSDIAVIMHLLEIWETPAVQILQLCITSVK